MSARKLIVGMDIRVYEDSLDVNSLQPNPSSREDWLKQREGMRRARDELTRIIEDGPIECPWARILGVIR